MASPKKSTKKLLKVAACPQCKIGHEYYRMIYNLYKFDVDLARAIVVDQRVPMLMDTEDVEHALQWARIHVPHLEHVDLKYPGIVAHYWYPEDDGTILHGTVLIDGHHRAAKAQKLDVPFYVHLLTEDESKLVTMRAPDLDAIHELREEKRREHRKDVKPALHH